MATVDQLYSSDLDLNETAYALYNDDPPPPYTTASSTYAHAKGMIMTNSTHGFWLVHSKPNWPNPRELGATIFPDTVYSQSLMCVSFNASTINLIAESLMIAYPFVYDSYLSTEIETSMNFFSEWIDKEKSTATDVASSYSSLDGVEYTYFVKSKAWNQDLYEDLVAPGLNSDLNVETWRLGSGGR